MLITSTVLFLAYKSQLKYVQSLVSNLAEQQTENLAQALQSDLHFIGAGANFFSMQRTLKIGINSRYLPMS
ncbi:hypothetical protein QW180_17085 [Vibrio sinaloensis]|nr:hypothetical protein [Vibrio sinaloensis]